MKVVGKLRQLLELHFVICEVFLVLHVVDVCVLNVLHGGKHKLQYNTEFYNRNVTKKCHSLHCSFLYVIQFKHLIVNTTTIASLA